MLREQAERVLKTEVPPEVHRRVRIRAAELDMSVARYVAGAVKGRLDAEDAQRGEHDGHEE